MTDQELLTYAAKAVGIEDKIFIPMSQPNGYYWNPLTSDADAFQLMVKLQLTVMNDHASSNTVAVENERLNISVCEESVYENGDEITPEDYAATRRAITRAAAEIGKGM